MIASPPVFNPFGPDHWAVLGCVSVASWLLIANASGLRRMREDRIVRAGLAAVLLGNEGIGLLVQALTQGTVRLPFQLCDLAIFVVAWALLGHNRFAGELAFLWGLAGSLQAMLTPDVAAGFPSWTWLTFFLGHGSAVVSAVYLAVRGRVQPRSQSVWRVWLISNGYVVVAGILNWRLGTNFGYLASKPQHPSLLDALGPWPFYIAGMEVIGLLLFFLCLGVNRMIHRVAAIPIEKGTRDA